MDGPRWVVGDQGNHPSTEPAKTMTTLIAMIATTMIGVGSSSEKRLLMPLVRQPSQDPRDLRDCHWPPRSAGIPRLFNSFAIPVSVVFPRSFIVLIRACTSALRSFAEAVCLAGSTVRAQSRAGCVILDPASNVRIHRNRQVGQSWRGGQWPHHPI